MRVYTDNTYKSFLDAIKTADTGRIARSKRNDLIQYLESKSADSVLFVDSMYNGKPYDYTAEQALFVMKHF